MTKKCTLSIATFIFLTFISLHTLAQTRRESAGKLFINQPRQTMPRDLNQLAFFLHKAFRSYDGTGNNISNRQAFDWGAADIALYCELPAQYGSTDPNNAMAGSARPSARQISNLLCDEPVTHFNERELSTYV